jgi:hydrophobic/amphiphilic exporter-1 (mainly G- bacteria), HAE1 family
MWLSDLSIKRPVFVTMLILALVVLGGVSYSQMGVDLLPDISMPVVAVQTVYPGANPTEIEASVSKVLEENLQSLSGVDDIMSYSSEGVSFVIIMFKLEYSPDKAVADVRQRVSALRGSLPDDIQEPVILTYDPNAMPIISFAVVDRNGSLGLADLRTLVDDKIKPRIQRVAGVAVADVSGGLEREIQVQLALDRMRALGVSPQQVVSAIQTENLDVPGGSIIENGQEKSLRTAGRFRTIADIEQTTLNAQGKIRVSDVAVVSDTYKEISSYNRLDGQDNIFISIQKQSGTNTVKVADAVRQEIAKILQDYPELDIIVASDSSDFVKQSTQDSLIDLALGALLAALVVFLFFRNLRNTIITVIGLPIIVVGAFWGMRLFGFTLNMITLLGLSLCIGLLIDDAIVVRENIFRHMEKGESRRKAASLATKEIALAVMAMTFSIVAVFLPVAFASGIAGMMFREFGITVAIAVLISLFEAFTLAPMLSAYFARHQQKKEKAAGTKNKSGSRNFSFYAGLVNVYRKLLGWTLRHRAVTLIAAALIFIASLCTLPVMGFNFMNAMETGWFDMSLTLPPGTALEQTNQTALEIEGILLEQPDVEHVFTTVGSGTGLSLADVTFSVQIKENGNEEELQQFLRSRFKDAGTLTFIGGTSGVGSMDTSRPVQISLRTSGTYENLYTASEMVMGAVQDVPGLIDVDRSVQPGNPELSIQVDRERASQRGLTTAGIGSTVRTLVNGTTASQLQEGDKDVDILVVLQEEDRRRYDDLLALDLISATGAHYRLSDVAAISPSTGPTLIQRQDMERQIIVEAGYKGKALNVATSDITKRLNKLDLPEGVTWKFTGSAEMAGESFRTLLLALLLSIVFMYMVLASQFSSFVQPVIVMLALPLAATGALLALLITGNPLDMTAMIGVILLAGIVTKNAILLVDFANQQRDQGLPLADALLIAGTVRLRPVLMTTLSIIFGMLPVAIGIGAGGEWRSPMAITVIGVVITSTVLTLVVVPVAYHVMEGRQRRKIRSEEDTEV